MNSDHVAVVYRWTAAPGKLEELTAVYREMQLGAQFASHVAGFDRGGTMTGGTTT